MRELNSFKLIFTVLILAVCSSISVMAEDEIKADDPISIMRGERVYMNACSGCHGRNGDGNSEASPYLLPVPRDFTSGVYRFRSTPSGELPTDEDIYKSTADGVPGTMMPAFKSLLSEKELKDVVAYTKTFSSDFKEYGPGKPIEIPTETAMTKNTISEGKHIYMVLGCWTCHGASGKGNGPSASTQADNKGNPLPPLNLISGLYKTGNDNQSLYKSINTGLDGSPMASYMDLFGFGSAVDMKQFQAEYTAPEIEALSSYLNKQFSTEQFNGLSEEEKAKVINKRKWSLVHYVKSLQKKPGIWHWLFGVTTDETAQR